MLFNILFISLSFSLCFSKATTRTDFFYKSEFIHVDPDLNTKNASVVQVNDNYSLNEVFEITHFLKKPIQKSDLIHFVSSIPKLSTLSIDFRSIIDKYRMQSASFYRSIIIILYEDPDPLNSFFDIINEELYEFSDMCKSYCLDAVTKLNRLQLFEDLDFASASAPSPSNTPKAEENNFNKYSKGAIFFAALLNNDFVTPITIASDMFADKPKPTLPIKNTMTADPDLLFAYSKVYCINTFSLSFVLDADDRLTIVGDKIPFSYFLDYMTVLQNSIIVVKAYDNANNNDLLTNKNILLENIWQQLEAFKMVALKMEDLIVFELFNKMSDLLAFDKPLKKLKSYLTKKVSELTQFKDVLVKDFPILNMDLIEQERLAAVLRQIKTHIHDVAAEEADLLLQEQMAKSRAESASRVSKNVLQNELSGNEFEAFATLYLYSPLKRTSTLITRAIVAVPEGITIGGLQGIYDFLKSVGSIFFGSPITSFILIFIGLAVIYSTVANVFSIIYNFFYWLLFPFLKIYKMFVKIC